MITYYQNRDVQIPDVFIGGAAKSGTTTLYNYLIQHPHVFFPDSKKEPFYFSFAGKKPLYTDDKFIESIVWQTDNYFQLYEKASLDQLLIDGSTSYLYDASHCTGSIKKMYGGKAQDLKFIFILRNPVDRAWSHYMYLLRNGVENMPFEKAIQEHVIRERKNMRWGFDYLNYGSYFKQLSHFYKEFNEDQLFVCLFEDLANPDNLMDQIYSFLNLETPEFDKVIHSNPSGVPTNKKMVKLLLKNKKMKKLVNKLGPETKQKVLLARDKILGRFLERKEMSLELRNQLQVHFRTEIDQLEKLIDRDLSAWKLREGVVNG